MRSYTLHNIAKKKTSPVIIDGIKYNTIKEASQRLGVDYTTLAKKVKDLYMGGLKEKDVVITTKRTFTIRKVLDE